MAGRELPGTSRFADDDGAADPELADALARHGSGAAPLAAVVSALATARVLVPVLAVENEDAPDVEACAGGSGVPGRERHAVAGVVAVSAPDGRTAMPVFTSVDALAAWHPTARPVPVEGPRAAAAALGEGWELLVLDPGGPVPAVVPRPAVHALAVGDVWEPAVVDGRVTARVRHAVQEAAGGPGVHDVEVTPGARAEVAVVLALPPGLSRDELDAVLEGVAARLAASAVVTAAVDSLEVRLVRAPTAVGGSDAATGRTVSGGADAARGPVRARRWRRAPGRR